MADIFWPLTVLTLRFKVSATCIIDSPRMKWRSTSNSLGDRLLMRSPMNLLRASTAPSRRKPGG